MNNLPISRSYENEMARSQEIAARLLRLGVTDFMDMAKARLPDARAAVTSLWRNGEEPMPFDEFCVALDGKRMFDRQVMAWDVPKTLRAAHVISGERTVSEWVLVWGKGTNEANTPLRDEATGRVRTMEEWCASGEAISLRSLVGGNIVTMAASPVFCKGRAQTYRVVFEDGRSAAVSPNHRFLTPGGWVEAKYLTVGEAFVCCAPVPHDEACVPGCSEPADYPGGCHLGSVPCGLSLSQVSKNCADAYQPLVREDSGEETPLECHISPLTHEALDLFGSLPLPEKRSLLDEYARLACLSPCRERECMFTAFVGRLYSCLLRVSRQPGQSSSSVSVPEADQCLSPARENSLPFIRVVAVVPHNYTYIYDLTVPLSHNFFDANGVLHSNSGKDYLSAKLVAWLAWILMQLREDPATTFSKLKGIELAPGSHIDIVNIAPTKDLARTVFFEYLRSFLKSPLFDEFKPRTNADAVWFARYPVRCFSMCSNAAGLDGKNPFAWVMDEADAFKDATGNSNAEILHGILRKSSYTRFRSLMVGVAISFPRIEDGFMLRLKKRAEARPDLFYVDLAGTSVVRPDFDMSDPQVQEEFAYNPAEANAQYNCMPMAGEDVFFTGAKDILPRLIDDSRIPCVVTHETAPEVTVDNGDVIRYVCAEIDTIERQAGATYFLTIDAAQSGDSYGLCLGHIDTSADAVDWLCSRCGRDDTLLAMATYERMAVNTPQPDPDNPGKTTNLQYCGACGYSTINFPGQGNRGWFKRKPNQGREISIGGGSCQLPHWYEDLLLELRPKQSSRQGGPVDEVYFEGVQEICLQVIRGLQVFQMRTDPWQTIQMVQSLRVSTGIDVQPMSFAMPEQFRRAQLFRVMLNSHLLTFRPNTTRDREVCRLQRQGARIDHPKGGSKDLYDAESQNVWLAACAHDSSVEIHFSKA